MSSLPSRPISQDLATVLEALDDGVTVLDVASRLPIFANDTYARLLGFESAEALMRTPLREVGRNFAYLDMDGRPVPVDQLPHVHAMRGERPPPIEVRVRALKLGDERWGKLQAIPLRDERGQVHQVVSIFRLLTGQRRAERTVRFLAEASKVLGASLDYHATLQTLIRLVVPDLADGCAVDIIEDDGSVQRFAGHADPAKDELAKEMRRRYALRPDTDFGPAAVLRTGEPDIVREYTDEMIAACTVDAEHARLFRGLGYREGMTVPLSARGRVMGTLSLILCEEGRTFDEQDLALAMELASRAALAVDNARLFREAQRSLARKDEEARTSELLRRAASSMTTATLTTSSEVVKLLVDEAAAACGSSFCAFIAPRAMVPQLNGLPMYTVGAPREAFADFPPELVKPILAGGGPLRIDDITQQPGFHAPAHAPPFRSYLAVKVHNGASVAPSALVLGHPEPGAFNARHEMIAQALATQAASALWNTYLFHQLRAAEAQSRSSEERLRLALGAGRMGNFSIELATGVCVISPEFEELLGLAKGEFDGRFETILSRLHPEDREPTRRRMQELARQDYANDVLHYRVLRPDGGIRWIEAHTRTLLDEAGTALRQLGVVSDITARREGEAKSRKLAAEQAARAEAEASERRIAAIVDSIGEPLFALDHSWRIRFVNRLAEEYLGHPREELLGRDPRETVPSPLIERVVSECEQARREGTIVTLEQEDGAGRVMELRACPYDAGVSVYMRDITARKRAQEAEQRRGTYEALRADISTALAGQGTLTSTLDQCAQALVRHLNVQLARVWMLDEDGKTLELASTASPPGETPPDAGPTEPLSYLGSLVQERRPLLTNALAASGFKGGVRARALSAGYSALAGHPLTVGDQLIGVVTVFARQPLPEDLSQALAAIADALAHGIKRRRTEQDLARHATDLARSNRELEQFAYVASHDLQEPLRMVASYTQLLARRYKGKLDADADEFIQFAVSGVSRMKKLIGDLLEYSRVGTKGKELTPTPVAHVMEGVLLTLRPAIQETHAEIDCAPMPDVMGDDGQLGQLFLNLITNALKFHRDGVPPRIRISVQRRGHDWLFSIADNGIGIEQQYFDRIFVIFQRLHGHEQYPGTGIGLAICKKIVERHGGQIWVESKPGDGTTFSFTLKAVEGSSSGRARSWRAGGRRPSRLARRRVGRASNIHGYSRSFRRSQGAAPLSRSARIRD